MSFSTNRQLKSRCVLTFFFLASPFPRECRIPGCCACWFAGGFQLCVVSAVEPLDDVYTGQFVDLERDGGSRAKEGVAELRLRKEHRKGPHQESRKNAGERWSSACGHEAHRRGTG